MAALRCGAVFDGLFSLGWEVITRRLLFDPAYAPGHRTQYLYISYKAVEENTKMR